MTAFARMITKRGENFTYTGFTEGFDSKLSMVGVGTLNGLRILDHPAFDDLTDIDIRCEVNMADFAVPGPGQNTFMLKWGAGPSVDVFLFVLKSNGRLRFQFGDGTTNFTFDTAIALPIFLNGTTIWLRVTLDLDDGAGNHVATFYYSQDNQVTWVQHDRQTQSPTLAGLADGSANWFWGRDLAGNNQFLGDLYRCTIHDGINGTLFMDVDLALIAPGTTSFADLGPNAFTVEVNQSGSPQAEIVVSTVKSVDDQGDVTYAADPTPDTIRGIRVDNALSGEKRRKILSPTGEEWEVDMSIILPDPLKNSLGVSLTVEDVLTARAPTVTDGAGRLYKVIGVGHEAANPIGAQRILCTRQDD